MSKADILLDLLPDRVFVIDAKGRVVAANASAVRELGGSRQEILGLCLWDLMPREQSSHLRMLVTQVLESSSGVRFVQGAGERWDEVSLLLLHGGDSPEVAIWSRDITLRVTAEEKAKRLALQVIQIQEEERRRISQDLHDDVGQRMTALILALKSIDSDLGAGPGDVRGQVKDAIRNADAIVRQVRQVFYQLHPPSLDTVPLPRALEGFCQTFAQQTGLHVDFSSETALPPIPELQATALYRLVQEGLNNAVKHSNATSAWVNLDCAEGEVNLSIEDNGEGFNPQQCAEGMGLKGVRERFSLLNGTLEIESAPGRGTRLFGSLPLTSPARRS